MGIIMHDDIQYAGGGSSELPVASANTLGGIKVGDGLSINSSGVLSSSVVVPERLWLSSFGGKNLPASVDDGTWDATQGITVAPDPSASWENDMYTAYYTNNTNAVLSSVFGKQVNPEILMEMGYTRILGLLFLKGTHIHGPIHGYYDNPTPFKAIVADVPLNGFFTTVSSNDNFTWTPKFEIRLDNLSAQPVHCFGHVTVYHYGGDYGWNQIGFYIKITFIDKVSELNSSQDFWSFNLYLV